MRSNMEHEITITISKQQAENLLEDLHLISDSSEHGHGNVMKQLETQIAMSGLLGEINKI